MKYIKLCPKGIMSFENYLVDGDTKAEQLEKEKADTSNFNKEKEVQKLKDDKEAQDKELQKRKKLFKKKKVA